MFQRRDAVVCVIGVGRQRAVSASAGDDPVIGIVGVGGDRRIGRGVIQSYQAVPGIIGIIERAARRIGVRLAAAGKIIAVSDNPAILRGADEAIGPIVGEGVQPAVPFGGKHPTGKIVGETVIDAAGRVTAVGGEIQPVVSIGRDLAVLIQAADEVANGIVNIRP